MKTPPMIPSTPSKTLVHAALAVATAALLSCNATQPPIGCPVQRLNWAARYLLKPGQSVTGACAEKAGERLGIQRFNNSVTGQNRLVIKPNTLAVLDAADPDHLGYSLADYPSESDADGFCTSGALSAAEKHVPADGADPAIDIVYQWKGVKLLSTPEAPGSQLVGDLTYTEDGCTAEYEVWASWPAVPCANEDGEPDDAICNAPGSGLNLQFEQICDPSQNRCVPARRPPSLKPEAAAQ